MRTKKQSRMFAVLFSEVVYDKKITLCYLKLPYHPSTSFRPFRAGNKTTLTPALRTGLSHFVLTGQFAFISFAPTVLNEIAQCEALGKKSNSPSPARAKLIMVSSLIFCLTPSARSPPPSTDPFEIPLPLPSSAPSQIWRRPDSISAHQCNPWFISIYPKPLNFFTY